MNSSIDSGSPVRSLTDAGRSNDSHAPSPGATHRPSRRQLLKLGTVGAGGLALSGSLTGLLTACSSLAPAATSSQSLGPNTTGTLTVWHYFTDKHQAKIVTDFAALFNKVYPKVTVKNSYIEFSQLSKKVIAAAGAKTGPDVIIYGGSDVAQMYKVGSLRSLQPYWDKYPDKGQYAKSVLTYFNNQLYAVKGYVNLTALWYNQDILDAAGVKPPKTFDDMTAALAKVAAAGKKYVPLALTGKPDNQGDWTAWPWLSGYGFSYDRPDQTAVEQTLTLVNNWAQKGYLPKEAVTWDQPEVFQRFAVGNVAFMENGNWNIASAKKSAKFKYGIVPMPTGPKGGTIFLGGEAEFIGAFSKQPDLAWAYLDQTFLSKAGNLIPLKDAGSIPARKDVAKTSDVTDNPLLTPFVEEVNNRGAEYPPRGGAIVAAQLVVAQNWSAVIAGDKTPSAAAKDTVDGVKKNTQS